MAIHPSHNVASKLSGKSIAVSTIEHSSISGIHYFDILIIIIIIISNFQNWIILGFWGFGVFGFWGFGVLGLSGLRVGEA